MNENDKRLFDKPLEKLRPINLVPPMQKKITRSDLKDIETLFFERKYDLVIKKINKFIKTYQDSLNAMNILGLAYSRLGNPDMAIGIFQSLINTFPNTSLPLTNLGNIFLAQGRIVDAINCYKGAIKLNPKELNAMHGLGNAYFELGQSKNALSVMQHILILEPKNDIANYNAGNVFRGMEKYKEAIPCFENTNYKLSKSHLLECFYLLNDKQNFLKCLEVLEGNKVLNPLVASLSSHSSIKYNQENRCSFCKKPFDYIYSKDLIENNLLDDKFINEIKLATKELNLDFKEQDLLKNGSQSSGNIFLSTSPVIKKLKALILNEIKSYHRRYKDSSDSFIKSWPSDFTLYGWVVSMTKGGGLSSHIHKEGWMSGSLYIDIPKKISPTDGDIVFSLTGANYPSDGMNFEKKGVKTKRGGLVLFPSSIFHHTLPFKSDEKRTTIAFDIIPDK